MIHIMTDKKLNEWASKERCRFKEEQYIKERFTRLEHDLWDLCDRVARLEGRSNPSNVLTRIDSNG